MSAFQHGSTSNANVDIDESIDQSTTFSSPIHPTIHDEASFLAQAINVDFLTFLFPGKSNEHIDGWVESLRAEEVESIKDFQGFDESAWLSLALPVGIRTALKKYIADSLGTLANMAAIDSATDATATISGPEPEAEAEAVDPDAVTQIDVVVMDISGSMKSSSSLDSQKTREDVSKLLFHTIMDKLLVMELSHAVGLLAFGHKLTPIMITREYELFHDQLGRLDANENSTMLYDAIYAGGEMIEEYIASNTNIDPAKVKKRVFALTDGDDNSSSKRPWQVSQWLQQRNIVLDAIPVAGPNVYLYTMCAATGGLCLGATSLEQSVTLFEREATLHLNFREQRETPLPVINCESDLSALAPRSNSEMRRVVDVRSAVSQTVFAPCLSAAQLQSQLQSMSVSSDPGTTSSNPSAPSTASTGGSRDSSTKRVMREYLELSRNPVDGMEVFVSASDTMSWKVLLRGLPAPYENGIWLLTVDFPSSFPFSAPRVRFVTPIYHCNVSPDGRLCLPILMDQWTPATTIHAVLSPLRSLVVSPNADDPLDTYKAAVYRDYVNGVSRLYMDEASRHTRDNAATETYESFKAKYHLDESA